MQTLLELGQIFFLSYATALIMPLFWIVLVLVFLRYNKFSAMERRLFGRVINPVRRQVLLSVGFGLLGGFLASAVLLFLGLSLEQIGLYFIWPVALMLLLVNPRFLCFSYAGGIVSAAVLFTRYLLVPIAPSVADNLVVASLLNIHIPALLVLIGLLHLVEALLIYLDGDRGSSPIYLQHPSGKVVGAYSMQRFWPIPLVALLVSIVMQSDIAGVTMPGWWPVLSSMVQPGEGQSLQYMAVPVAAGLGYGDLAYSSKPRQKATLTARQLAIYSVVLLAVALAAEVFPIFMLPGALFAPFGHELLIMQGNKKEAKKQPIYSGHEAGVKLMMVLPGTDAADAGLQEEDTILKINGTPVEDSREIVRALVGSYFMVLIEGLRQGSEFSVVLKKKPELRAEVHNDFSLELRSKTAYAIPHRCAALGFIPVPPVDSPIYLELKKSDPLQFFKNILAKTRLFSKTG